MRSTSTSRRTSVGVVLAAVLAVCAIVAASASAARPEYTPLEKNAFNLAGGEVTLEASGGIVPIHCKKASGPVEILNVKEFVGTIALTECSATLAGACTTKGAAKGEIVAKGIHMRLAYTAKATHEVGLVINPQSTGEPTTLFAFACEHIVAEAKLRGAAIAKLTPINTMTKVFTLGLKGASGLQELTQYENESGVKVTASSEMSFNGGTFTAADVNAATLELQGIKFSEIVA
jgi:hypothetical protein